ncbi:MAG TPA: isoprenylcysteine carboxylmethyltransferase family protein, partial [Candidatus Acidoferrales bacterium]|nr:isoprenylcysteine carboxylmethyltransferase family protein [Candidatus Acidoferrales bacterium]
PPFAFFYFYFIFANAFRWPTAPHDQFFYSAWISWVGVLSCAAALALIFLSLLSFGRSFRVGIDAEHPDRLVTSGIFGLTRNPMYVAFSLLFLGEFLIKPNSIFLTYLVAGIALLHRQVLREEHYLAEHYGEEYRAYCQRVRRYV